MKLCILARVLELIENYLMTRTSIAQEILGLDLARIHSCTHGEKLKKENSVCKISSFANFNKNMWAHRKFKLVRIDFVSFLFFLLAIVKLCYMPVVYITVGPNLFDILK